MPDLPSKFSFDAVYYHVKDMGTSIGFYRNVLGFLPQSRDYVARFKVNGVFFELVPRPRARPSLVRQCSSQPRCQNIEDAIRYLSASGVQATR